MPASSPDNRPIMPEALGRTRNPLGHNEEPPPLDFILTVGFAA